MPVVSLLRLLVPVLVLLLASGCTSGDPAPTAEPSASASDSSSGSPSASPSPDPSASPSSDPATSTCLFTVAQVTQVLGGTWEREEQDGDACGYTSDRGATFVTNLVDQPVGPGLRAARDSCLEGVRPVTVGNGFVCVERQPRQDLVVGNIGARGLLWVVVIVPGSDGLPEAELQAMAALLDAVER